MGPRDPYVCMETHRRGDARERGQTGREWQPCPWAGVGKKDEEKEEKEEEEEEEGFSKSRR